MNHKHQFISLGIICLCLITFAGRAWAADARTLTLPEAVQLALRQNRALRIARLKVTENEQKKAGARSAYFPEINNHSSVIRTTSAQNIEIPRGAFGLVPNAGLVPANDVLLDQGAQTFVLSGTTLTQPLTQLIRIRQSNVAAASEVLATKDELKKAENQVALQVHALYFGILIARLQKHAAEQQRTYATVLLREAEQDVANGSALRVSSMEARAKVLESDQAVLAATLQLSDLNTEFDDLLGLPLDTPLELSTVETTAPKETPRSEYFRIAWAENPEVLAAAETVRQAKAGVTAAKSAYIPDVAVFARQSYQNGVPFLVHNFGSFGVNLTYDIFDFGKRRAAIREREAKLAQAQENLERLKEETSVRVERSLNKVERTKQMIDVASEVAKLRQESERLTGNQLAEGAALESAVGQAVAASAKAQADLLQARLANILAQAELEQATGRTPGL